MFTRSLVSTLLLGATLALARIQPSRNPISSSTQCSSGSAQCCNSVASPGSANYAGIIQALSGFGPLKDFAGAAQGNAVPIGVSCNPLTGAAGASGSVCQSQAVCCDHTANGGSFGFNCIPLNFNL
ncbi:hypothetical protein BDV98DRAFT_604823 [Pterulicium gracile]|uniref:Hydrophobin n=1 Tax=Pterulicium gracile TaxID=1884261 RepID=A0A5C3QLE6_9AGAR|nr:hypothetical protein BDV98DRAFT_604823 [Pterula gracilis]